MSRDGTRRSPSPVYGQIDNLKAEHERARMDAQNGIAVKQNRLNHGIDVGGKKLMRPLGLDTVDGNTPSILAKHAGLDTMEERRQIISPLSPAGFGSMEASSKDVRQDEAEHRGWQTSVDEDAVIDHTTEPLIDGESRKLDQDAAPGMSWV